MANICRSLRKNFFSSPVLKSPTHIGFIDVIKNGSKISHLGTFKNMILVVWKYAQMHQYTFLTTSDVKKYFFKNMILVVWNYAQMH